MLWSMRVLAWYITLPEPKIKWPTSLDPSSRYFKPLAIPDV